MLKYIIFAILALLLTLNFLAAKILGVMLKREPTDKEVIAVKTVLYVIMLIGVIYIMVVN